MNRARAAAFSLFLLLFTLSCGDEGTPREINVVLITLDTLRPDRLGCYGHPDARTPAIDRLAREGILFTDACVEAPQTLPSHATILTGVPPPVHGVHRNASHPPRGGIVTLAERFRAAGYRTGAVVASFQLDAKYGLDRGFDSYDDDVSAEFPVYDVRISRGPKAEIFRLRAGERRGHAVVERASGWLDARAAGPFFLWLHFFDPHVIYDPPPPFDRLYPGRPYPHNRYDGEVAYLDRRVADVRRLLEERGLYEKTILVILSDHGEGLGEHGETYHDQFIYESTVRTALIFSGGALPPDRVSAATGLARGIDLIPTILDLAGVPGDESLPGRSLVPLLRGEDGGEEVVHIMETYAPEIHRCAPLHGVRTGRWKYIEAPTPELYDLESDPGERVNLAGREPERAAELRSLIAGRLPEEERESGTMDRATRERLEAIGYLTEREPPGDSAEAGIDPKDLAPYIDGLHVATMHYTRAEYDSALQIVLWLNERYPGRTLVFENLANLHMALGRLDELIAEFEEIVARHPGYANGYYYLGAAHMQKREDEEAIRRFREALAGDPNHLFARFNLAAILARNGWLDEALVQFEKIATTGANADADLAGKARAAAAEIRLAIRREAGG
ncbi:MAG: sulfatase-like hydrolase/transferase [Candidatus Eisenbacteria bacterium]